MTNAATEALSVVVEREIPFPPEKIWRALTQPHLIEEWLMKNDFKPVMGHGFNLRADCLTRGVPMVSRVSSLELSPLRARGPICAWSSRASGRISGRRTRARRAGGRISLQTWSRYWRG